MTKHKTTDTCTNYRLDYVNMCAIRLNIIVVVTDSCPKVSFYQTTFVGVQ